ncbi:hypothetical protein EG329_011817 [Mollisiaceae sp. DMI_Dod_QoI]|nr:hypothetical protein EG329_011817 [Helotiales sp. DMI_Dod_QoI]
MQYREIRSIVLVVDLATFPHPVDVQLRLAGFAVMGFPPLEVCFNVKKIFWNETARYQNRAIGNEKFMKRHQTLLHLRRLDIVIKGPVSLGFRKIYKALCPSKPLPKPRYATLRMLHDPLENQVILDSNALVLYFPAPNTVTGEDVLELHIHGGPATVKAILAAIPGCSSQQQMIRMAEPGEFTRRAFENDRLDLSQVEALSDTLAAETEQQRRAAVRGNSRKLGRTYDGWREHLLYARGELEALIDFSEDQHFDESPADLLDSVSKQVTSIVGAIVQHEHASYRGDLLRKGIEIALIGPPNAGKSSLLNLIVGREASIVSSEAGTTRDIVEVRYDIGGYLCTFADTAGLRTASRSDSMSVVVGDIEQEGMKRARAKAKESDVIIVFASIEPTAGDSKPEWTIRYDTEALSIIAGDTELSKPSLIVVNKCDSPPAKTLDALLETFQNQLKQDLGNGQIPPIIGISCLEATTPPNNQNNDPGNIAPFITQLKTVIASMTDITPGLEDLLGVTERQRQLLSACKEHLTAFMLESSKQTSSGQEEEADIVIAAEHLRSAADCLSRITGRGMAGDVEEVLGVVFEKFCVGK